MVVATGVALGDTGVEVDGEVAVATGVAVGVGVGVGVTVGFGDAVGLTVGLTVGLGVGVGFTVGLGVGGGVGVGVGTGVGLPGGDDGLTANVKVGPETSSAMVPAAPTRARTTMAASDGRGGDAIARTWTPGSLEGGLPRSFGLRWHPTTKMSQVGLVRKSGLPGTMDPCAVSTNNGFNRAVIDHLRLASDAATVAEGPMPLHEAPPDDVVEVLAGVRAGVVRLGSGAYVVAMVAVSALLVATVPVLGASVGMVLVVGLAITAIASALLERALRRIDRLNVLSVELSDLYGRARLDSLRDPLTGLGNHRAFQEELDLAVQSAKRHQQPTTLLLLDVDDLKRINDAEGHAAGDAVLQAVAGLLLANLRRIDRAFRIGGDEFAILSPQTTPEMGLAVGRRILATALEADRGSGKRSISFTIGISAVPEPSRDRTLLYRHADAALYWGKRHGRTDVRVYDPRVQGVAEDERPATELATAVDRIVEQPHQLIPMFQPVFDLRDGSCRGLEGLVRPGEDSGFRDSGALFRAAEAVSRTVELDIAAVRRIAAGAADLAPDHYLAVNLSPRSLEADGFNAHEILSILARAGIQPARVVVELTEREEVEDVERLQRNLEALRRSGVRIAADDVGAGNAGLRLLSMLAFDIIKIDMSLVQSGAVLAPSRSVLHAIIEMAERSGATTVAEGIETPVQLKILRDLGIQVGQGYLLGMPRATAEIGSIDIQALLTHGEPDIRERLILGLT